MSEALKPAAESTASPGTTAPAVAPPPPPPPVDAAAVAAQARKAERERVAAIIGCEEAKGREQLAQHVASNTDLSVEQAKAMLNAAPKTSSVTNPLAAAMAGVKNPEVGSAAGEPSAEDETISFINATLKPEGRA